LLVSKIACCFKTCGINQNCPGSAEWARRRCRVTQTGELAETCLLPAVLGETCVVSTIEGVSGVEETKPLEVSGSEWE
jgi:aerobic-type carbon monoxide dehydrogenase small subunit (CoxS/CutS family)